MFNLMYSLVFNILVKIFEDLSTSYPNDNTEEKFEIESREFSNVMQISCLHDLYLIINHS